MSTASHNHVNVCKTAELFAGQTTIQTHAMQTHSNYGGTVTSPSSCKYICMRVVEEEA